MRYAVLILLLASPLAAQSPGDVPRVVTTTAAAPVYAPPTPGVCEQELQQGCLSAPTVSYLGTLPLYERYAYLHQHYRHGFADRQFTRHFGKVPGTFRNKLLGLAPRTGGGGRHR